MNTLSEELQLLDDYLQMEQLRFGFQYDILNNLKIHNDLIDIPNLLLQPIVENAVKHGISTLGSKGKIVVTIDQQGHDLVLGVADNGARFNTEAIEATGGYGLRLTKERLALLEQLYPENSFQIQIKANSNMTEICIVISHWIANI
ncbi:ATP-binding protein [Sphingobacterium multivorum]|nr:ATP-binding protein [Sphingobacterium multivorum]